MATYTNNNKNYLKHNDKGWIIRVDIVADKQESFSAVQSFHQRCGSVKHNDVLLSSNEQNNMSNIKTNIPMLVSA